MYDTIINNQATLPGNSNIFIFWKALAKHDEDFIFLCVNPMVHQGR